jgi:hypothetical protein
MWKWIVSLLVYCGNHQCMMHFLGAKVWECFRRGRLFPIPESLTRAGSVMPETSKPVPKSPSQKFKTLAVEGTKERCLRLPSAPHSKTAYLTTLLTRQPSEGYARAYR